ncbi:MAG: diguanylate cyclase [Steroidobacteraceae bacterium]|nr:diguanylate cyclase [Steroidobacteraceae bacterium]
MLGLDPGRLRQLLEELQEVSESHERWQQQVGRVVLCRLPADPRDLREDSHLQCAFGRWYHQHPPSELRDHPAFAVMAAEHERVHRVAARVMRTSAAGAPVAPGDFDEYVAARERLMLELDSLRHEIDGFLGSRDALTGAHRRLDLLGELRQCLELSRRGIQSCCIAFMDLDRFKSVNDTQGHRVGDDVLAGAASFVMKHLRPFDKVFRYGGDEFLICMPGADFAAGRAVIERVREGLAALPLGPPDGPPVHVTASFGLALLDPPLSVEECIDRADQALLMAKAAGRNRSCCWEQAADPAADELPFGEPVDAPG